MWDWLTAGNFYGYMTYTFNSLTESFYSGKRITLCSKVEYETSWGELPDEIHRT